MNSKPNNPELLKVLRLIADDGTDAANQYIDTAVAPAAENALRVAQAQMAHVANLRSIVELARPAVVLPVGVAKEHDQALPLGVVLGPDTKAQKRQVILSAAEEVADRDSGIATIEAILAVLKSRNVELGGARPGTAVGNTLLRAEGWMRVEEGKFRREISLA